MAIAPLANRDTERRDALVARLFEASIGTLDIFSVYIGDRLRLYQALAESGQCTSSELAAATGTHERYIREWLEQQAATGLLEVVDAQADPTSRRFRLPAGHDEVLLDGDSLNYMTPLARLAVGVTRPLPALLEMFRTGGGVPYRDYGREVVEAIGQANRTMFINLLGQDWLPRISDVHARLQADPPARVADIGCGTGWSSIALARAYPKVQVDGLDVDESSIDIARANAAQAGLADRVHFLVRDAADPALEGRYDLVTAFETLHDMARPVEALRAMRALAADTGTVIVADERVGETLAAPAEDYERLCYGFSVLPCLTVGMADPPSAATGTVMRTPTLRRYANEAGFPRVEVLPIEHDFWRFYRLVP